MIDAEANRYSFAKDAKELKIVKKPKIESVEVPVHPDKAETRKIELGKIFISKDDLKYLKGKEVRLLHLYNIKLGRKIEFTSEENKDIPKINWVSDGVETKILMPDGKWISGMAEKAIEDIEEDEIIQFERFGFCRFDRVDEKGIYEFWFAHR